MSAAFFAASTTFSSPSNFSPRSENNHRRAGTRIKMADPYLPTYLPISVNTPMKMETPIVVNTAIDE